MDLNDIRCPSQTNDNFFDAHQHYNHDYYENDPRLVGFDGPGNKINAPDLTLLSSCEFCNRTFLPNSLAKHKKVCYKNWLKNKEKEEKAGNNMNPQYNFGGERPILTIEQMLAKRRHRRLNWRLRHEEFLRAVHAARDYAEAVASGNPLPPPPPPVVEPDLKECPYCHRRFHEKAHEKHVLRCKEQSIRSSKEKPSYQTMEAKRRLAVRLYYQPNSRPNSCLSLTNPPTPTSFSRPSSRATDMDYGGYGRQLESPVSMGPGMGGGGGGNTTPAPNNSYVGRHSSLSSIDRREMKIPDYIFENMHHNPGRKTPRITSTDKNSRTYFPMYDRKTFTPISTDAYPNGRSGRNSSVSQRSTFAAPPTPVANISRNVSRQSLSRPPSEQSLISNGSNYPPSRPSSNLNLYNRNETPSQLSRANKHSDYRHSNQALDKNHLQHNIISDNLHHSNISLNTTQKHSNIAIETPHHRGNRYQSVTPTSNIKRSTSCTSQINTKHRSNHHHHHHQGRHDDKSQIKDNDQMRSSTFKKYTNKPFVCTRPTSVEPVTEPKYPTNRIQIQAKEKLNNTDSNSKQDNSQKTPHPRKSSTSKSKKAATKKHQERKKSQSNSNENLDKLLTELKNDKRTEPASIIPNHIHTTKSEINLQLKSRSNHDKTKMKEQIIAPMIQPSRSPRPNRVKNEMQIRIKSSNNQPVATLAEPEKEIKKDHNHHHSHHHKHHHHRHHSKHRNSSEEHSQIMKPINDGENERAINSNVVQQINPKGEAPSPTNVKSRYNSTCNWTKGQGDNNTSNGTVRENVNYGNENQNNGIRVSSTVYQCKTVRSVAVTDDPIRSTSSRSDHQKHHQRKKSSSKHDTIRLKEHSGEKYPSSQNKNIFKSIQDTQKLLDNCTHCGKQYPTSDANFCSSCGSKRNSIIANN